jgi:phosphohistidine phosphatase
MADRLSGMSKEPMSVNDENEIEETPILRCVLFRHGIAAEREEWTGKDADRPLTDNGKRKVRRAAAGLRQLDVRPSRVLTSPLMRAVETAKLLHVTLAVRSSLRSVDELLPDAPAEKMIGLLHDLSPGSCVLCVGHEPHLGMTASLLLSGRLSGAFPLKKAGACLIELPLPVKPGRGRLIWWLTPSQLRRIGKESRNAED